MDTIRELFKIGYGPSSSHTMGPQKAAKIFKSRNKDATRYKVELYGSLAATGKGHLTDFIILKTLGIDKTEVLFKPEVIYEFHTNGMKIFAYNDEDKIVDEWLIFSVGGGTIMETTYKRRGSKTFYQLSTMEEILNWCKDNKKELWEFVVHTEGEEILDYLKDIWNAMKKSVTDGLEKDGVLPGELKVKRRAKIFYDQYKGDNHQLTTIIYAAALAVAEQNASGGQVVTAPTCGASGVLPSLLYALHVHENYEEEIIIKALAVAGLIGNLIKENASISGAEVGCQGEIGSACSMASGAITYILGGKNKQIEYAAEIGLEHHLGMTCDPVGGYVQVPCIERNAMSAKRALDAAKYALLTNGEHIITLDQVINTMGETGRDLHSKYRETSEGGLAKFFSC